MNILITGSDSFIGKNLKTELIHRNYKEIFEVNDYDNADLIYSYVKKCDVIIHLLTLYKSKDDQLFNHVNVEMTRTIVTAIKNTSKRLLFLSSTQVGNNSIYGSSKDEAERIVKNELGDKASIYRLAHEFGKWCAPDFNSVVATFCNNIASGQPISINNPDAQLKLMYVDDIVENLISGIEHQDKNMYIDIEPVYEVTVGVLADIIYSFREMRDDKSIPELKDELIKKLYSTYLSYLPSDDFSRGRITHKDSRGSFTELFHFGGSGQVSVNITKPGVTKGNHWHHTKNEKFVVIFGKGIIRFRNINDNKITEYKVSSEAIEVVDIPPGYTHNISNIGDEDMVTLIWANEIFDNQKPDTHFEEV